MKSSGCKTPKKEQAALRPSLRRGYGGQASSGQAGSRQPRVDTVRRGDGEKGKLYVISYTLLVICY
jgi:hypothetical protein